jgi:hypothetical protein
VCVRESACERERDSVCVSSVSVCVSISLIK